jgi:protein-tyrosine phosphatase
LAFTVVLYFVALVLALILVAAVYLWWQSSIKPAPYDVMFEVREGEPVRISRDADGWLVTPADGLQPTTLRLGTSPQMLDTASAVSFVNGRYHAPVPPRPLRRYFFEIDFEDGRTLPSAERVLPLEGAVNFRDLGGYDTTDGRRVAWGRVYRSDELYRLTDADRVMIRELGVKLIVDLRSDSEVADRPDRAPEGVAYRRMPVYGRNPIGALRILFVRHRLDPAFKRLYRDTIIDEGAPVFGDVLRLVADPTNLPLVWHCTSGKDRTGIAAALLLHICGVPRDTIIVDYTLTNLYADKFLAVLREAFSAIRTPPGVKIEQLYPFLSARPELIEHAFAHIESTYGSVDDYLRGPVGLTAGDLAAIRRNLLTP